MNFGKYRAYIFDLDNTLYDEVAYLYPALFSIARDLDNQYRRGYLNVSAFLKNTFIKEGRKELFDKLIIHFDFPPEIIDLCLNKLRTISIDEKIDLREDMQQYLKQLIASGKKIFVLTNGNVQQQKNKVEQINWMGMKDKISFYFSNEIEPKPSPAGIFKIISDNELKKSEFLFIGDDEVDRLAAEFAGIDFAWTKDFTL